MNPIVLQIISRSVFLVVGIVLAIGAPPLVADDHALYPTDYVYTDVEGNPLPFQDSSSILKALKTGEIVEREIMSRGVANNIKLVLDYQGTRFHAVLRLINVTEEEETGSVRMVVKYRDTYIFEAAAFELNELLGIRRIPPTTIRRVDDAEGSIQIWMEGMTPEDIMLEQDRLRPPDRNRWWQQKGVMWVFDALIANTDRNQGNLLIDEDWNLWLIDHTRAFRETSVLFSVNDLKLCERGLWTRRRRWRSNSFWRPWGRSSAGCSVADG